MASKSTDFSFCPKFDLKSCDPETWLDKWDLFQEINETSEDHKINYEGLIFDGHEGTGSQNLTLIRKIPGKISRTHLKLDTLTRKITGRRSAKYSNISKNQTKTLGNT